MVGPRTGRIHDVTQSGNITQGLHIILLLSLTY